jgi:type IV pilus assembly protein PilM
MTDKPNAMHALGLDLSHHTLQGAELAFQRGKPCLVRIFEVNLESNDPSATEPGAQLFKSPDGKVWQSSFQKNLLVTCLHGDDVLIRQLEIQLKKEADIDAVLAFQAEPILPYPIDNAVVDRIKVSEGAEGSLLTVVAVRKDHLQKHLDTWHRLEIEPEVISCSPVALAVFSRHFSSSEKPQLVLHIGQAHTLCILTHHGKLQAALNINGGTVSLSHAFELDNASFQQQEDIRTFDFLGMDKEKHPHLSSALENMRLEVTRTVYALSKQIKGQEISAILLTGDGAAFNNLPQALCQTLNKTLLVPVMDPLFNLSIVELQKFALPIGAALTALPHCKNQVNFRQNEFSYPYPWRRYKKPASVYVGLCLLLAIAFYFMTHSYIKYREDQVRQEYSELLQFMHRPYTEFERDFDVKAGGKKLNEHQEVLNIKDLTQEDLIRRLQFLDADLQSSPYYYPLMPNTPTVSDVLAWLSTHPNVVAKDPKMGAMKPLLEIESFNYTMVKRPDQTKKQEKYQVKVELEFSSPTPKLAREFHDALIAPNAFVDPKGEVKWSTNRGLYRASFFLKDKTLYPSSS